MALEAKGLEIGERVRQAVREIPDFPVPGVSFKDITTVVSDGELFREIIAYLGERYREQGVEQVVGIESRGFIFGAALAHELGVGLTLVRKPGKLPFETVGMDYELEYGVDRVEMHVDALEPGEKVVIVDDLLATGGTCGAALELVEGFGAEILEVVFLIELSFLNGRERLGTRPIYSVTVY